MSKRRLSGEAGNAIFVEDRKGWRIELHWEDGLVAVQQHPPFKTYEHARATLMEWERDQMLGSKFGH